MDLFVPHERKENSFSFELGDKWYAMVSYFMREIRVSIRVYEQGKFGLKATRDGVSLTLAGWRGLKSVAPGCREAFEKHGGGTEAVRSPPLDPEGGMACSTHLVVEMGGEGELVYRLVLMKRVRNGGLETVKTLATLSRRQWDGLMERVADVDAAIEHLKDMQFVDGGAIAAKGVVAAARSEEEAAGRRMIIRAALELVDCRAGPDASLPAIKDLIRAALKRVKRSAILALAGNKFEQTLKDFKLKEIMTTIDGFYTARGLATLAEAYHRESEKENIAPKPKLARKQQFIDGE